MSPKRRRNPPAPEHRQRRKLRFTDQYVADADYWADNDPATHRKLLQIVGATLTEPFRGLGKPEPLKHDLQGLWSRRLTRKDRVVYEVGPQSILFLSARYHYSRRG